MYKVCLYWGFKVISWQSVKHLHVPWLSHRSNDNISSQNLLLLFSHAPAARVEKSLVRKFVVTGNQICNCQIKNQICYLLSHSAKPMTPQMVCCIGVQRHFNRKWNCNQLWVEFSSLNNFFKASPKEHPGQVSSRLALWLRRRCLKKLLTDNIQQTKDNRNSSPPTLCAQVITS